MIVSLCLRMLQQTCLQFTGNGVAFKQNKIIEGILVYIRVSSTPLSALPNFLLLNPKLGHEPGRPSLIWQNYLKTAQMQQHT